MTDRIDTTRPAMIFDPWPFARWAIALDGLSCYATEDGQVTATQSPYFLSQDDNVLCWSTAGRRVVCKQDVWNQAQTEPSEEPMEDDDITEMTLRLTPAALEYAEEEADLYSSVESLNPSGSFWAAVDEARPAVEPAHVWAVGDWFHALDWNGPERIVAILETSLITVHWVDRSEVPSQGQWFTEDLDDVRPCSPPVWADTIDFGGEA